MSIILLCHVPHGYIHDVMYVHSPCWTLHSRSYYSTISCIEPWVQDDLTQFACIAHTSCIADTSLKGYCIAVITMACWCLPHLIPCLILEYGTINWLNEDVSEVISTIYLVLLNNLGCQTFSHSMKGNSCMLQSSVCFRYWCILDSS